MDVQRTGIVRGNRILTRPLYASDGGARRGSRRIVTATRAGFSRFPATYPAPETSYCTYSPPRADDCSLGRACVGQMPRQER